MVDDYTKKFFFSIETDVRKRCLENIKNEFYNFINRYLPPGEIKSAYNSTRTNEMNSQDMHKRIMSNHESVNKEEKNLYTSLCSYNNGERFDMVGNNCDTFSGCGFNRSSSNMVYNTGSNRKNWLHLNNLQHNENERNEFIKIEGVGNDLVLKLKKSSILQNNKEQDDIVEYLKNIVKNEKEKNMKLELEYDELKQKYELLKKKREEDILKEMNTSKNSVKDEENFFKKFYQSQSIIKLEDKILEDSSKRIVDENLKLIKIKEINEQNKKEIEKDMHDADVKKKEIEKDLKDIEVKKKEIEKDLKDIEVKKKEIEINMDTLEIKKKEIELENEMLKKKKNQVEVENELIEQKKKQLEDENSTLDDNRREVDRQNDLIKEKKTDLEEANKLLEERQKRMEEADKLLEEKQKRMEEADKLLEEKQKQMEEADNLLEERQKRMEEADKLLEKRQKRMEEADKLLEERQKRMEEADKLLEERQKRMEEADKLLEERQKRMEEADKLLEERQKRMEEADKLLEERERRVEEADKLLHEKQKLVNVEDILLNEKQRTMQRKCTIMEDKLNQMTQECITLGEKGFQLHMDNIELKSNEVKSDIDKDQKDAIKTDQKDGIRDDPTRREHEDSQVPSIQNNNYNHIQDREYGMNKRSISTLDRSSIENIEKEKSRNNTSIEMEKKRNSVLSYLGSTKFSLKDISKREENVFSTINTSPNAPHYGTATISTNDDHLILNDKDYLMKNNEIIEREQYLLNIEEKLNKEREQISQQINELNVLKDDISNRMEALKIREDEICKKEEELKMKETYLRNLQKKNEDNTEQTGLSIIHSKKETLSCNSEQINISDINIQQQCNSLHCGTNSDEIKNPKIIYEKMTQLENYNRINNQAYCEEDELNELTKIENSKNLESNNSSHDKDNKNSNLVKLGTFPSSYDHNSQKDCTSKNLEEIKSNLNNDSNEIEKCKRFLKSRDSENSSIMVEMEKQENEEKWNGGVIYEMSNSQYNSKNEDFVSNNDNTHVAGLSEKNDNSSLSHGSGNDAMGSLPRNGSIKESILFSGVSSEHNKNNSDVSELNTQKTMKNVISREMIMLYREISKIKEEYNKSILKKNEFIGGLLHNFFNEMRNNYKFKENLYLKESSKYQNLINDKECYIKELKNALQEKKAKEVSYKKMLLKMNQINDAYKLKNKRSLSTVEMLKQDIKLLNQDVLKKKEMIKKFEVAQ